MIEYCDIYDYLPIFGYDFDGVAQRPRIRSSVLIDEYFCSHSLKISGKDQWVNECRATFIMTFLMFA